MCSVLSIQPQSYYKWIRVGKPIMNNYSEQTAVIISVEHKVTNGVYGTHRLKHHIYHKHGIIMNHKKIRRYKNRLHLHVIVRKKRPLYLKAAKEKNLTNKALNLLNCNFTSEKPLEKLSSDVSYIKCTDGTLYLSAVKDIFNKEIISYSTSSKNNEDLVINSYNNLPNAPTSNSILHTDQGSLYLAYEYVEYMKEMGYTRSMSQRGCCWQNSPIENWFSQLKEEWLRPRYPFTKREVEEEIKKYVLWYNTERIQKGLDYLSPIQYKLLNT
ncbi:MULTISPECIES: IS3 family transposase [unclassified Breznakia]|uniref:IS3 family transposase n=1 Tax=Breznakia sp. PF5-3 TaxID=2940649 RepID=UPI0024069584|nr:MULTISPECIES: IS3 family transposase [unclassified Breznakia]